MWKSLLFSILLVILCGKIGESAECRREGQECGRLSANLPQFNCCSGEQLSCIHKVNIPEGSGVCKKVCSSDGELCGGNSPSPKHCCQGFECVVPNTGATDIPGSCHQKSVTH